MTSRPAARRSAGLLLALGLLTGCGFQGVYSLPLPGAAGTGDDTYRVVAQFDDVLDLVPYSAVKVQNATVGHVVEVRLVDGHAEVVCQLDDSVVLPENTVGRVAETSLLGEKYVSLDPPRDEPAVGTLGDGGVVPLARTMSGATVEEVLGALSLVLNGSGLEQVRTITVEVNNALEGRSDGLTSALRRLDDLVGALDEQKGDILRALEGVERLSGTLAEQEQVITAALVELPPAFAVLAEQREALTRMLTALSELGTVGTRVVEATRDDLLANLRELQPTLRELALASEDIPKSLDVLATYPFARDVGTYFHGDYGNMWFTIDLNPEEVVAALFPERGGLLPPAEGLPGLPDLPGVPLPGLPGPPALPSIPGLAGEGPPPGPAAPVLPAPGRSPASDIADMLFGGLP